MYDERLESLIDAALADGELTEKEKQILFKNAQSLGVDLDEFEMVLAARLFEKKKKMQQGLPAVKPQVSSSTTYKFGDVRKCPQCGAPVQAMQAICPECGHEFTNISANSSAEKLSAKLQQVSDKYAARNYRTSLSDKINSVSAEEKREKECRKEQAQVITSFPVPNTKEDLLEFAIMMRTGFKSERDATLSSAYRVKFKECVLKMKLMFPDDPMFKALLKQGLGTRIRIRISLSKRTKSILIGLIVWPLLLAMFSALLLLFDL